jgi:hypothetical protein
VALHLANQAQAATAAAHHKRNSDMFPWTKAPHEYVRDGDMEVWIILQQQQVLSTAELLALLQSLPTWSTQPESAPAKGEDVSAASSSSQDQPGHA